MKVFIVSCLLLSVAFAEDAAPAAEKSAFSECFDKDSISCVQLAVRNKKKPTNKNIIIFINQHHFSNFNSLSDTTKSIRVDL